MTQIQHRFQENMNKLNKYHQDNLLPMLGIHFSKVFET